jgi:competence ComEA-like helix-hairpin-helix protein
MMRLRIFAPTDAAVATLLLLVLTLVAVSGLVLKEEGPGFAVQLRSQARERATQEEFRSARDVRVNLNRAGASLLATLPGIGPTLAEGIVRFREVHGPFRHISDVKGVPGIGRKRLRKMLPYLTLGEEAIWSTR